MNNNFNTLVVNKTDVLQFFKAYINNLLNNKNRLFSTVHLSMSNTQPSFDLISNSVISTNNQYNIPEDDFYIILIDTICEYYNISFDYETYYSNVDGTIGLKDIAHIMYDIFCYNNINDIINFITRLIESEVLHTDILYHVFKDNLNTNIQMDDITKMQISQSYVVDILNVLLTREIPFNIYLDYLGYSNSYRYIENYLSNVDSYVSTIFELIKDDRFYVNIITAIKCNIHEKYANNNFINDLKQTEVIE